MGLGRRAPLVTASCAKRWMDALNAQQRCGIPSRAQDEAINREVVRVRARCA